MQTQSHPLLTFWRFSAYGGVGTSRVDRAYEAVKRCPACGAHLELKSYVNSQTYIAGKGSRWPDILSCDLPIVHERVVATMSEEGLTGFIAHPTQIVDIDNETLKHSSVPQYYLLDITGRVDIDPGALDEHGGAICPVCFTRNCSHASPYRWKERLILPILSTWDSSNFVLTRNWRTHMRFCTSHFIDLACKHGWTNFVSTTLMGDSLWRKPPAGKLSYLDPDWLAKLSERVKIKHSDLF